MEPTRTRLREPVRGQRGMVTAELAFASIGAALIALMLGWVFGVLGLYLNVQETAIQVARQAARGDQREVDSAIAAGPDAAQVSIRHDSGQVLVTVSANAPGWVAWLPDFPVTATATVGQEPS